MNTIILAAGATDYQNMVQGLTSSKLLTLVNGRPIISWVVGSVLRGTTGPITLVLNGDDAELTAFCRSRFGRKSRLNIVTIKNSASILHTLQAGYQAVKKKDGGIRVILGDTLLTGADFTEGDYVWVSDYRYDSGSWCVVTTDVAQQVKGYLNKVPGLPSEAHKALVGRYDFSKGETLGAALEEALAAGKREISDVLELYGHRAPLTARTIPSSSWIDFGHLEGIAKARARLMESRAFNSLRLHEILPIITKTSTQTAKLRQELDWYNQLPGELAALTPRIFETSGDDHSAVLKMEYYGYGTLAEKFLFFDLSPGFWANVLSRLMGIVSLFKQFPAPETGSEINLYRVYCDKTLRRFSDLRQQGNGWAALLDMETVTINGTEYKGPPVLTDYIHTRCEELCQTASCSIVHGDLCFNNILYDISSGVVKLIDPRGEFGGGAPSIYGDPRYDIAKLRHSYCGNYDHIVEGDFEVSMNGDAYTFTVFKDRQDERDNLFDELCRDQGYAVTDIRFIEALLFLSMIPLHSESLARQTAFFLNGLIKLNDCYEREQE